jgi:pimeloyl-ACP methyl ester carboxylesterase
MSTVTSRDGTEIAFERRGEGPPVILVGGGLDDGAENAPLAAALAGTLTVYNYSRRGRGSSGDTQPFAVAREIEDVQALVAVAGGSAHVYGVSSGGGLVLEAAAAGVAFERIAVYEIPWNLAEDWPRRWREYRRRLQTALARQRRDDALELFLRVTDTADDTITAMRCSPYWGGMQELAHTLAYDAACLGDGRPPAGRLAKITQPTLVATGAEHPPASPEWVRALDPAADEIAAHIPHAQRLRLEGQSHVVDADTFAPVLARFFAA